MTRAYGTLNFHNKAKRGAKLAKNTFSLTRQASAEEKKKLCVFLGKFSRPSFVSTDSAMMVFVGSAYSLHCLPPKIRPYSVGFYFIRPRWMKLYRCVLTMCAWNVAYSHNAFVSVAYNIVWDQSIRLWFVNLYCSIEVYYECGWVLGIVSVCVRVLRWCSGAHNPLLFNSSWLIHITIVIFPSKSPFMYVNRLPMRQIRCGV